MKMQGLRKETDSRAHTTKKQKLSRTRNYKPLLRQQEHTMQTIERTNTKKPSEVLSEKITLAEAKETGKESTSEYAEETDQTVTGVEEINLTEHLHNEELLKKTIEQTNYPIELQKQLAAKMKLFIDNRIAKDIEEKGYLTDYTRRNIELYEKILNNLHKNLYGEKSINLNLHERISHVQLGEFLRNNNPDLQNKNSYATIIHGEELEPLKEFEETAEINQTKYVNNEEE